MICNSTVEIFTGTPSDDGWGDVTFAEGLPIETPGHIGNEMEAVDKDGLVIRKCSIRIDATVAVTEGTVFRVAGQRWKPLNKKVSRNPQQWAVYYCQRLD